MNEPNIAQKFPFVIETKAGTYHWCTCGHSKTEPFCDGSHKGSGFKSLLVEIPADKTVAWCGCKHSKNGAFCDGSHKSL
jgi:CDGSH iron-sulfur domain-containing protein 3